MPLPIDFNQTEIRTSMAAGPAQRSLVVPPTVPDLSDKIIRLSNHYCEAGGFADIYKCHYNGDDGVKEVAVKAFRFRFSIARQGGGKGKIARMIRREMGIWKRVTHPNIVPFLGIAYGFGKEESASLVSLWMSNGALHTFLAEHDDHLTDAHRLQLLLGIANGLSYLHSFPIIHGDLSCNNVLLDDRYIPRLVDFGFASLLGEIPEALAYLQMTTRGPGTIRWAAPEHFLLEPIQRAIKSDIYSLGNLAFLVLSGNYPWSEVQQDAAVMLQLSQGHKPTRPESRPIQDTHWGLIEHCWSSIDQRPPTEDVVSSLEDFLRFYPTPQPLCDFLSAHCASAISLYPNMAPSSGVIEQQDIDAQNREEQRIQAGPSAPSKASLSPDTTCESSLGDQGSLSGDFNYDTHCDSQKHHQMPSIPTSPSRFFHGHGRSRSPNLSSSVISLLRNPSPFFKSTPFPLNRSPPHHSASTLTRNLFIYSKSEERTSSEPLEDWEVIELTGSGHSDMDGCRLPHAHALLESGGQTLDVKPPRHRQVREYEYDDTTHGV